MPPTDPRTARCSGLAQVKGYYDAFSTLERGKGAQMARKEKVVDLVDKFYSLVRARAHAVCVPTLTPGLLHSWGPARGVKVAKRGTSLAMGTVSSRVWRPGERCDCAHCA